MAIVPRVARGSLILLGGSGAVAGGGGLRRGLAARPVAAGGACRCAEAVRRAALGAPRGGRAAAAGRAPLARRSAAACGGRLACAACAAARGGHAAMPALVLLARSGAKAARAGGGWVERAPRRRLRAKTVRRARSLQACRRSAARPALAPARWQRGESARPGGVGGTAARAVACAPRLCGALARCAERRPRAEVCADLARSQWGKRRSLQDVGVRRLGALATRSRRKWKSPRHHGGGFPWLPGQSTGASRMSGRLLVAMIAQLF